MMEAAMDLLYILTRQGPLSNEDIAFVTSVADPGCFYRIPDPNFSILDPDPHYRCILKLKNCFLALRKIFWDVHPGSKNFSIPSKKRPIPGLQHCV
jgi:hypothetical protein